MQKKINGTECALKLELNNYQNYNNKDDFFESSTVQNICLTPSASVKKNKINFDVSLYFRYLNDYDRSKVSFFPQIKATKELVRDVVLVSGGLRHIAYRNTLKLLSDQNPYIHSYGTNQSISNDNRFAQDLQTTDSDELYFTIRNILGKDEVFEASLAYGKAKNFLNFILFENGEYLRFRSEYLASVWQLHANGIYNWQITRVFSVRTSFDYYKWDQDVYNKSNITVNLRTPINLREKIKVIPSFTYLGARKFNNILSELPAQFFANLSLYYSYSNQLSVYLEFNNILNSKEDIFQGYQQIGFNGHFGLNFSF